PRSYRGAARRATHAGRARGTRPRHRGRRLAGHRLHFSRLCLRTTNSNTNTEEFRMKFVPRQLADGRICCSNPDGLCDKCRAHFGLPAVTTPPDDTWVGKSAGAFILRASEAHPP